jgi:hypothetical protein
MNIWESLAYTVASHENCEWQFQQRDISQQSTDPKSTTSRQPLAISSSNSGLYPHSPSLLSSASLTASFEFKEVVMEAYHSLFCAARAFPLSFEVRSSLFRDLLKLVECPPIESCEDEMGKKGLLSIDLFSLFTVLLCLSDRPLLTHLDDSEVSF